jgi:hypothetical protein
MQGDAVTKPPDTYMVTLPSGERRGPFSRELLLEVARSGGLPTTALVEVDGQSVTVETMLLTTRRVESSRRLSAEERAQLGGTQAATPSALRKKDD